MAQVKSYRYAVVDVFTTEPLAGNPLAVFPDASEFDETTMQKIARELNLAETAFMVQATREDSMDRIPHGVQRTPRAGKLPRAFPPDAASTRPEKRALPRDLEVSASRARRSRNSAALSGSAGTPFVSSCCAGRETRRPASTTGTQVVARSCRYLSQNFPF